jgi:glycosyltransferase involved in cell wall biosynthesis
VKKYLNTQLMEKNEDHAAATPNERADVAILMCTYNGAAYLREQLESFETQSLRDWNLYVSDDSSTDETRCILAEYQRRWGESKLIIFQGPCQGFAKNFVSLIKRPEVQARYYAFSDQDDVWFSDKLERSVKQLDAAADDTPALYCSRTRLINADGSIIGFSPLFNRPPSFRNALVQSLAGANTMLVNDAARDLLMDVPEDATIVAHDWLTYLVVTACGGTAVYDEEPTLDYRQHGGNLIGANASFTDRITRIRKMLSGRFVEWNDANLHILSVIEPKMTLMNTTTLRHYKKARNLGLWGRLRGIHIAGLYRQTFEGNASLVLAACLGRL